MITRLSGVITLNSPQHTATCRRHERWQRRRKGSLRKARKPESATDPGSWKESRKPRKRGGRELEPGPRREVMWLTLCKWLLAYDGDEREGATCTELSGDGVRGGERAGSGRPLHPCLDDCLASGP